MSIPFTQYLRPDGDKRHVEIDRPGDVELLAQRLLYAKAKFDIEELRTGEISMTCEMDCLNDPVLAIEVCQNGPPVVDAVDRLVRNAFAAFKAIP